MREIKDGSRTTLQDSHRSGCPSTAATDSNIDRIKDMLQVDNRISVRNLSSVLKIGSLTVHEILHAQLHLRSLCSGWVPKELNDNKLYVSFPILQTQI